MYLGLQHASNEHCYRAYCLGVDSCVARPPRLQPKTCDFNRYNHPFNCLDLPEAIMSCYRASIQGSTAAADPLEGQVHLVVDMISDGRI